ncbi:MAG: acyl-CoA dehydrogenase family protein [Hyphomicrobiales bacterium]|nr:acyl-CoA dehydrogenase family protein [Hyphomicrobiales bacterium]
MLQQGARANAGVKLLALVREATRAAEAVLEEALAAVRERVQVDGRTVGRLFDREQRATHGLAWLATYVESIRQAGALAEDAHQAGTLGEVVELALRLGIGEFLAQIHGGIPMSPGETVRPADLGLSTAAVAARLCGPLEALIAVGNAERRARLVALLAELSDVSLGGPADESLLAIREEVRSFAESEVAPNAHAWHLANRAIPLDVIAKMSELGVFGLTIPERYGGLGLGKQAMCVVTEELSRAYLGVGSLGTRAEIAGELIAAAGTEQQKARWLPQIASGAVLPTAVFTEPDAGSDMAAVRTRAVRHGDRYRVYGNKTWITHAARADLMVLLVRTDRSAPGYPGLSILLAPKPRGSDADAFPAAGLSGTEIEVLGYRGMKEYEIAFDGFEVAADNLLGAVEGRGFKQLMQCFEGARIQTAARALGVAQASMEAACRYAVSRRQFGGPIIRFPRIADKLATMLAEILMARALTYFAARRKDSGQRCDLEAGMAKLLAARVAWTAADNAVQIHGGNGFALEFPVSRLLCDARILSIFEGAAEIQANIVARRLLDAGR